MQIKLNEDGKKSMAFAVEKAIKLQHSELGGEHLLLGVLSCPSPVLSEALESQQINAHKLCVEIESNLPSGAGERGKGEPPLSRSAKEVLHAASLAAQAHHAEELGPEHLMLGILGLEKNTAFLLLKTSTQGKEAQIKADLNKCLERLRKRRSMTTLFNDQASTVIIGARSEAEKSRSEFIEPAHILLGITSHAGSVAMAALLRLKVNMKALNPNLQRIVAEAPKRKSKDASAGFSDETKKLMDKTVEASEMMRSKYIGPEHMLLGILSMEGSKACQALKDAGVVGFKQTLEEIQMVLAAHN